MSKKLIALLKSLQPPPGAAESFLENKNAVSKLGEGSIYGDNIVERPENRFKIFSNFQEDTYIDRHVLNFCRTRPICKDWLGENGWEELNKGKLELPYGHTKMTEKAWRQGLEKFFPKRPVLTDSQVAKLDKAFEWVDGHFYPFMHHSRILTHDEVLGEMNFKASSGYPLRSIWPKKSQAYQDPMFMIYLFEYWEAISEMNAPQTIYTACLKDEIRPREKLKLEKTRVFTGSTAENSWACARLFKDQRDKMKNSFMSTSSCIGIRQTNLDFHFVFRRLRELPNCASLDASNWDGNILADLLIRVAMLRFKWLEPEERTEQNWWRVMNLYRDTIFTRTLFPDGYVYRMDGGMPSGWGLTADDNTLMHYAILSYVAISLGVDFNTFVDETRIFLYGDDNTYSYTNAMVAMAPQNIVRVSKELGVNFEIADCEWDSLKFLQHHFLPQEWNGTTYRIAVRDIEPILCGWLLDGDGSWQNAIERTSSYRIQAYFHPALFELMTEFMTEKLQQCDPRNLHGFRSLILSECEIRALYFTSGLRRQSRGDRNDKTLENVVRDKYHGFQDGKSSHRKRLQKVSPIIQRSFGMAETSTTTTIVKRNPQREHRGTFGPHGPKGSHPVPWRDGKWLTRAEYAEIQRTARDAEVRLDKKMQRRARKKARRAAVQGTGSQAGPGRGRDKKITPFTVDELKMNLAGVIPSDQDKGPGPDYLRCLVGPAYYEARIPDEFGGQVGSCTFRSTVSFESAVQWASGNSQSGRFTVLAQPTMGSITRASRYKIATSAPNTNFLTADWASVNTYTHTYGDADLRLDAYYPNMTIASPGYAKINSDATGRTGLIPMGTTGGTYDMTFTYLYQMILKGFIGSAPGSPSSYNTYVFPQGVFSVTISLVGVGIGSIDLDASPTLGLDVVVTGLNSAIGSADSTARTVSYIVTVTGSSATLRLYTDATSISGGFVYIAPTFAEGVPLAPNSGVITKIRPVGMSLWGSYENNQFNDAGQISICLVPAESCKKAFFLNVVSTWPGQLQFWEKLKLINGAYTGRLNKGVYCWWAPSTRIDTDFYTVSDMVARDYPCIIASGQISPLNPVDASTYVAISWKLDTVYEFQTMTQLWHSEANICSNIILDTALQQAGAMVKAGPNGFHLALIAAVAQQAVKVFSRLGSFAWENRSEIGSLAVKLANKMTT